MATSPEYTKEQLNYYRICYVTTDILTEGLRSVFKQEWDNRYKATLGEWKDDPKSGMDFYNSESPRNQKRNAHLLVTMTNGVRAQWDCTTLFYAILYSDCIGGGLSTTVKTSVDVLRKFRNEEFAHMPRGFLTDADFQTAISQVRGAFQSLGLSSSIKQIDDLKNQTSFPTEELRLIMNKVDDLEEELRQEKQQRKVLEDQLEKEISPFCVLPPKPSHQVTERNREANEITKQLKQLKEANKNDISYLYISGNPGSGKSQLARLVAKRFFDEAKAIPSAAPCVMTLNAANPDSLLESYASFVRQLKCPEYAVTNTLNSKDITTEEKITNLKTLVATKIDLYTTWLLVVDNVPSMSWVHAYLPEWGNEQWSNGQVLITTQDVKSIPLTNSFVKHFSISRGMDVDDACLLLAMLSGISDCEMGKEAAKTLDYQPLALASAATYVNQVRQKKATSNFHWADFLEKVQKGKRGSTEKLLEESNPSYPKSMTSATSLAVENVMLSDKIIDQTFTLLSLCATQPLDFDIVNNYILKVDEQAEDKESIDMTLKRCSLVIFEEDQDRAFIRVHQVVHDAIKTVVMKDQSKRQMLHQTANAAVTSFSQFIDAFPEDNRQYSDTIHIVPHLKAFITMNESLFPVENAHYFTEKTRLAEYVDSCLKLGVICTEHYEFHTARKYYDNALSRRLRHVSPDHATVASIYDHLGILHRKLGDPNSAKEYHNRALEIKLKKFGNDSINTASTFAHLGVTHLRLGDLEKAREYQDSALKIYLKKLRPDHSYVARSYGNLGSIHKDMGELESAKKYVSLALEIQLKTCPNHTDVATTYSKLGKIQQQLGDLERAKEYQDRALAIRLKKLGPDHTDVATTYSNLGYIHMQFGDLERAREYHNRSLEIELKKLGNDNINTASTLAHLGVIHLRLGDLEKAREYQDSALKIYLKKLRPDHSYVARSYGNLGSIHKDMGELESAKKYVSLALEIQLKTCPDHTDVAITYSRLSEIHQQLGDLERAKEYQDRALAIRLKNLGPDHTDVATTYSKLGDIHQQLGDLERAKEYQDRALAIRLKKLGPDHTDVATTYSKLGEIHQQQGDLERAKEYQDRAFAVRLKKLGPDHTDVATTYSKLGYIHMQLGDLERAREYHNRTLEIELKKLGNDSINTANTLAHLGVIHLRLGDLEQAREYQDSALKIYLKKLRPDHSYVARSYGNLGSIHKDMGELESAKKYVSLALEIQLKTCPDHTDVAITYSRLSEIHQQLGDLERAKEYQDRALAIRLKNLGPDHTDVATTYSKLGDIHQQLGDLERAKEYQDHALAIRLKKLGPDHTDVATTYSN